MICAWAGRRRFREDCEPWRLCGAAHNPRGRSLVVRGKVFAVFDGAEPRACGTQQRGNGEVSGVARARIKRSARSATQLGVGVGALGRVRLRAVVGAVAGALTDGAECPDSGRWMEINSSRAERAYWRCGPFGPRAGSSPRRRMRLILETLAVPHDGGGVIHTARAAGTADGRGVGGSGAPGRGGWSGGDTAFIQRR